MVVVVVVVDVASPAAVTPLAVVVADVDAAEPLVAVVAEDASVVVTAEVVAVAVVAVVAAWGASSKGSSHATSIKTRQTIAKKSTQNRFIAFSLNNV